MINTHHHRRSLFLGANPVDRRVPLLALAAALLAFMALASFAATRAFAVTDGEELFQIGGEGPAAGQLNFPEGIATDSTTAHLFTAELGNNRISEFTPWGEFVKAFGWDVAPGAVNEQQEVRIRAAAGQFKLSFEGKPTQDIAFDAPASVVQSELDALESIGGRTPTPGSVTVSEVPGTPDGATPYVYVVAFKGSLAGKDVPQLVQSEGTTPLSGGSPSTTHEVRTRADGTVAGTGLESCTAESGCKAGLKGAGAGERGGSTGVAVDASGDIYVREFANNRVQKFDPAGRFELMLGGGVDQGPHQPGNICTAANVAEGDTCGAGSEGAGPGEFAKGFDVAVGADGTVFVPDNNRIEEFEPNGAFKGEVAVAGEFVRRLALDPANGGFYATFATSAANSSPKDGVHVLSRTGAVEASCGVGSPESLASDPAGNLYAVRAPAAPQVPRVVEFNPSCNEVASLAEASELPPLNSGNFFALEGLGTNAAGDLYVSNAASNVGSFIRAFGPGPVSFEAPPAVAPTIVGQAAGAVASTRATVAALINPHFWTDTHYYVQYGPGECSAGECTEEKPLPPGALLTAKAINAPFKSAGISLEGLAPGTTYHYRIVAQSSGGGPVRGIGGKVGLDGRESAFTTFPATLPARTACPNQVFRIGPSAPLPDCRAYEMVSPVDKDGADIKTSLDLTNTDTALDQSAEGGESFTYSSFRAFADPKAAPFAAQYLARREAGVGWATEAISPPQNLLAYESSGIDARVENEFKGFSPDLCRSWLVVDADPLLAAGADPNTFELYDRDDCGGGGYEALAGVEPGGSPAGAQHAGVFSPEPQGTTADGSALVFRATPTTTPESPSQTYYAEGGELSAVCILPDGSPTTAPCSAGTYPGHQPDVGPAGANNHVAYVDHALSADGSRLYWSARESAAKVVGSGQVYLRENPGKPQSAIVAGHCTEPELACTVPVSETKSPLPARFLDAATDGSEAIYEFTEGSLAGQLYEFDLESGSSTLIAKESLGLAGAGGPGGSLADIYLVSRSKIAGTVPNGRGEKPTAGKPNLYLDQEGTKTFVAILSPTDVTEPPNAENASIPSDVDPTPIFHAARASADGGTLAFISTADLTGYDNTDAGSPLPCGVTEGQTEGICDSEVYLYEAGSAGPRCISCDPSGAQPQGREVEVQPSTNVKLATAGALPLAQDQLYLPRALSPDGSRLFFDSYDRLVARDTNGKEDVYEWEAASSQAACEEDGAELYVASSGGCLSLISSGEGTGDSGFLDSSDGGVDAFFTTNQSLLPQDPGLIDVYDAREGGGFPATVKPGECGGIGSCQPSPAAAPAAGPGPGSTAAGPGNPRPKVAGCRKGTRKVTRHGRTSCVKSRSARKKHKKGNTKNKQTKTKANDKGRAGR